MIVSKGVCTRHGDTVNVEVSELVAAQQSLEASSLTPISAWTLDRERVLFRCFVWAQGLEAMRNPAARTPPPRPERPQASRCCPAQGSQIPGEWVTFNGAANGARTCARFRIG